jgi:hypothetical protein
MARNRSNPNSYDRMVRLGLSSCRTYVHRGVAKLRTMPSCATTSPTSTICVFIQVFRYTVHQEGIINDHLHSSDPISHGIICLC